jgi:hypothetical protein
MLTRLVFLGVIFVSTLGFSGCKSEAKNSESNTNQGAIEKAAGSRSGTASSTRESVNTGKGQIQVEISEEEAGDNNSEAVAVPPKK